MEKEKWDCILKSDAYVVDSLRLIKTGGLSRAIEILTNYYFVANVEIFIDVVKSYLCGKNEVIFT